MRSAERAVTIEAPPAACSAVLLDFESWPDWQPGLSRAEVIERDADGLGTLVAFEANAVVRRIRYRARYTHAPPESMAWELVDGDVKAGHGEFRLEPIGAHGTRATYRLVADLGFFVPGRLMRKGTELLMGGVTAGLKRRAERD
jgi:ribosome-associated toxin RatA of RatAB toxin-antitoxin module